MEALGTDKDKNAEESDAENEAKEKNASKAVDGKPLQPKVLCTAKVHVNVSACCNVCVGDSRDGKL